MQKKVLQPITIRGVEVKNRIGFAPFVNMPAGEDGEVSDRTIRWFEERARGGVGLIMTGAFGVTTPSPEMLAAMKAAGRRRGLTIAEDRYVPGLARLAEVVHSYGARLAVQIVAGGPLSGQGPSPSPYPDELHAKYGFFDYLAGHINPVVEVSVEQLQRIQEDTAAAAARLKAAGVDFVELHCAHGGATLNCSFISPFYNRRTDDYGGSWENRLRLPVETIRKMRQAVGEDYPIFARIDADELLGDRGITVADAQKYIVPALEAAGVDCFDVSQGSILHSPEGINIPLYYPRGHFIHNAAAVKQVTDRPVIGVGRIVDMEMAERFIQEGKADIIYMGSQLCADPETPKKYFEGIPEETRRCIACKNAREGECGRPCSINYDIQDDPIPLIPAEKATKVLVIGSGVGGMEAARIAALRGHRVTLFESDSRLGGVVAALALNPLTAEFGNIIDYLSTQLRKLAVDVRLCKKATPAAVQELNPDVVILATGSSTPIPEAVAGKPGVMTHSQAARQPRAIGQRVVVWGFFGVELAITLAEQGRSVSLIGRAGEGSLGSDLPRPRRWWVLRKLTDINAVRSGPEAVRLSNPRVLYNVTVEEFAPGELRVVDGDGTGHVLPCDTLILSARFGARRPNDSLYEELQGKAREVYKIGDCAQVRGIKEAIWTANELSRKI